MLWALCVLALSNEGLAELGRVVSAVELVPRSNKQTNLPAVTSFLRQRCVPPCSISALHLALCWFALWQVSDFLRHSYHQLSFNIRAVKYTTQVVRACYEPLRPCHVADAKLFGDLYDHKGWGTLLRTQRSERAPCGNRQP